MTAILRWVRSRLSRTRIYHGTEQFGPTALPWHEVLRRTTANVPNPKGQAHD